jgi:FkbM family methyltransferase
MLQSFSGLLKPCYLFAPATLFRRISLRFTWPESQQARVDLPWGAQIEVNLNEAIGNEIFRQRVFDLAVSECAWRLLCAGDRVIDAGANIGYMTLLFAARVSGAGSVDSFEPHPAVRATLERNVRNQPQVTVHSTALGAERGSATLFESDYFTINQGSASIANVPGAEDRRGVQHSVKVEALDDLFPTETFALLKIDVEGFETQVVAGAERLLRDGRVANVIYEDHTLGESGLASSLTSHGYTVFAIGHGALGPLLLEPAAATDAIDSSWESASFLATRDPARAQKLIRAKGWRVLRGA